MNKNLQSWISMTCISLVVMSLGLGGLLATNYSMLNMYYYDLLGESLIFDKSTIYVGHLEKNKEKIIDFSITNVTKNPIKLLGYGKSCSCSITTNTFPVLLHPKQTRNFNITIRKNTKTNQISESMFIYNDSKNKGVFETEPPTG